MWEGWRKSRGSGYAVISEPFLLWVQAHRRPPLPVPLLFIHSYTSLIIYTAGRGGSGLMKRMWALRLAGCWFWRLITLSSWLCLYTWTSAWLVWVDGHNNRPEGSEVTSERVVRRVWLAHLLSRVCLCHSCALYAASAENWLVVPQSHSEWMNHYLTGTLCPFTELHSYSTLTEINWTQSVLGQMTLSFAFAQLRLVRFQIKSDSFITLIK